MSIEHLNEAFSTSLKLPDKAVLVALADRAKSNGQCWPSLDDIAFRVGCTKRTVISAIKRLEVNGFITVIRAHRKNNRYQMNLHPQGERDSPIRVKEIHPQGERDSPNRVKEIHPQGERDSPQPSENHHLTTKEPERESSPAPGAEKKFNMFLKWKPDNDDLKVILFMAGGSKFTIDKINPAWTAEFVAYWWSQEHRKHTQREWTSIFAKKVIGYMRNPGLFERQQGFDGGEIINRQHEAGSKRVPDWARIPRDDNQLRVWAINNGFRDAFTGEEYQQYRGALQRLVNARLIENNLAKISF